jgi:hypothetical protein
LRRAHEVPVLADAHQPAHGFDPQVGSREEFRFGRAARVGGFGEDLHHLQHGIRQPRAEDDPLVLGKAIHAVQHPFHVVIRLRQGDRQVGGRGAFFHKKFRRLRRLIALPASPHGASGSAKKKEKGKELKIKGTVRAVSVL